jgi:hypothetical protein
MLVLLWAVLLSSSSDESFVGVALLCYETVLRILDA